MSQKKTYQRYSTEFKEQALGLLGLGKPVAEVAQELQISTNLLYAWRRQAENDILKKAAIILGSKTLPNCAK